MLFDAHNHAFTALGGVPERGIYDNMKTAVDRVGRGKLHTVNARFQVMVSHFMFEAEFCNPAAGWEKGQVEKNVRDAHHRIWHTAPKFKNRTVADVWEEERPQLMSVPALFDGFVEHSKRVSSTCLVTFESNRYSVPASFANRPISLQVYADKLVFVAEGNIITEHHRVFTRDHNSIGKTIYDWRHYLSVIQRKPGALRNGAPFRELPLCFRQCQKQLLKHPGGDREMVDVLAQVLQHDEQKVEQAVKEALASGKVSRQHIINCLSRLLDAPMPSPLKTPNW